MYPSPSDFNLPYVNAKPIPTLILCPTCHEATMQRPQVSTNVMKPVKLLDTLTLGLGVIPESESVVKYSPDDRDSVAGELRAGVDRPGAVP